MEYPETAVSKPTRRTVKLTTYMDFKAEHHIALNAELRSLAKIGSRDMRIAKRTRKGFSTPESVRLDPQLLDFYSLVKHWHVKWDSKDASLEGTFNILPFEGVLDGIGAWSLESRPILKTFAVLDAYSDFAAVGLLADRPEMGLFHFEFDGDPQPLHLDFSGYLRLLKYTRGYHDWRASILVLAEGGSPRSDICEKVTGLFPGFSSEGLKALYEKVKLREGPSHSYKS